MLSAVTVESFIKGLDNIHFPDRPVWVHWLYTIE